MLGWITANLANIVICLALALLVAAIVRSLVRGRRQGKASCCGGSCGCCPMGGACHGPEGKTED